VIRAVLIDDEPLALERLKRLLLPHEGVQVVGSFTSTRQAIDCIPGLHPDVAFLDIEMPGINGLEATEQILAACESMDVVFVTAFNKYAVEAFELNALDYLLKPVSEERMAKAIRRLLARRGATIERRRAGDFRRILCFGRFEVADSDFKPLSLNWRTVKCRELFAYLVLYRGIPLTKDRIIESLWPDLPMERTDSIFHTTLYYLRRVLQDHLNTCAVRYARNNQYILTLGKVYYDVDYFERMVAAGQGQGREAPAGLERAVQVYRGDYLEEEYFDWAAAERNRLQWLYLGALKHLSKDSIRLKDYAAAEAFLRRWLGREPLAEEAVRLMMEVHARQGNHQQLHRDFEGYRKLLSEELGAEPAKEVRSLLYRLMNETLD